MKKDNDICDKAIIEISKGNREALSYIYDAMAKMIFLSAYSITGNYADAEDALQETMIQVVKYSGTYKQGSNYKAWILTMTRHISVDIVRKRRMDVSIEEADIEKAIDTYSDTNMLEVFDMLKDLEHDDRQLILYRLYWDMSYIEIARIMNISVYSAQKRYQRAVKKLRKYIS